MTDAPQINETHEPHAETSLPPVTPSAAAPVDGDGAGTAGQERAPRARRSRGGRGRRRNGPDAQAGEAAEGAQVAEDGDGTLAVAPEMPGETAPADAARQRNARHAQHQQRKPQQSPSASGEPREGRGGQPGQGQQAARHKVHPVLERLFTLYPKMFGARFLPLKLGVYQDLLERHGDEFKTEDLKLALGLHARSTRYLDAVAAGHQRHDLEAEPVEPVAPEHVHHAILETFRRRQGRTKDDLGAQLRERIIAAIESSGIGREAYVERVRARDPHSNAALDDALAELGRQAAKREALLRAFEASGKTDAEFADMYGMEPKEVSRTLQRARKDRKTDAEVAAAKAAAAEATEAADAPEAADAADETTTGTAFASEADEGAQP
ncbi:MAG: ProQ/FINO family protein [Janthinobacterium lividum]